jgi:predicted nucleotidyltransferase
VATAEERRLRVEPVLELAEGIAARIGELEGVAAVALGGSWARGGASPDSDADLGIYYEPIRPFAIEDLRRLARELDDRRPDDAVTGFGEWGPWINGGGWLVIGGQRVDWLYRDLAHVRRAIEECRAGRPALHHQPGHPHGFHTHIYLGEIHHCVPLHDPRNVLRDLKTLAAPYPRLLKKALVRSQLWKAGFALYTTRSSVERGDVFHASGSFFQCVACLVQTLHALSESYPINEKGALEAVDTLALRPDGFVETASAVLSCPGDSPDRLRVSLEHLEHLAGEARALCADLLADG